MAFAKRNEMIDVIPIFDLGGVVTDVQAKMRVTITENGVDTQLVYVASISIWATLTPTQKATLGNIMAMIRTGALASDIPIPLVN